MSCENCGADIPSSDSLTAERDQLLRAFEFLCSWGHSRSVSRALLAADVPEPTRLHLVPKESK